MMNGLAELGREQILERQRIGISRAKPAGKYQDRKSVDDVII